MVRVYLSEEGCRNLHKYKYSGTDASLAYKFILSPLSEFCVKFIPLYVAANTVAPSQITFLGHICCLLMYALPWLYCGHTLSCLLPSWLIFLCIVFYFAWIILDNIDGKQARRTNNSTPLGLLFDHQVDAINVTLTTTFLGTLFLYGDTPFTLLLWVTGALPFYFATWEELFLGSLDLPMINGPCEGCIILGLMGLFAAAFGPEYFVETLMFKKELRNCFMLFFISAAVLTGLYNVARVLWKTKERRTAIFSLLPFFYYVSTLLVLFWSPAKLMYTSTRELMLVFGFTFAREIGLIQVAHVTSTKHEPMDLGGFIVMSSLTLNTYFNIKGSGVNEYSLLLMLLVLAAGAYSHFVINITSDICKELKIKVFSVNSKL
mmetsp:Transcript_6697/g.11874  ORF Transcript_6697/g.11874 Transcript_6697/m.11874 type:complete len:376 (+) Transcript_6697:36-1163(+)